MGSGWLSLGGARYRATFSFWDLQSWGKASIRAPFESSGAAPGCRSGQSAASVEQLRAASRDWRLVTPIHGCCADLWGTFYFGEDFNMELQDIYVCHSFVKCLKGYLVRPAKHDYDALMSDNHRTPGWKMVDTCLNFMKSYVTIRFLKGVHFF